MPRRTWGLVLAIALVAGGCARPPARQARTDPPRTAERPPSARTSRPATRPAPETGAPPADTIEATSAPDDGAAAVPVAPQAAAPAMQGADSVVVVAGGAPPVAPPAVEEAVPAASEPPLPRPAKGGAAPPPSKPPSKAQRPLAAPAQVVVRPVAAEVGVGSAVTIAIEIAGATQIASVPFHLLFDGGVLAFQGAQEGTFLGGDGHPTVFMAAPDEAGTRVVVGLSRLGSESGISGDGLLCVLSFVALAPGDAALAVDRAGVMAASGTTLPSAFEVRPLRVR